MPPSQTLQGRSTDVPISVGRQGPSCPWDTGLEPWKPRARTEGRLPTATSSLQGLACAKSVACVLWPHVMPACSFHVPKTHGLSGRDLPRSNFPTYVHTYVFLYCTYIEVLM